MLGRPIQTFEQPTSEKPARVKFEENETYSADCVISTEESGLDKSEFIQHRAIILLSRRICLTKQKVEATEGDGDDVIVEDTPIENALFVIPPGRLGNNSPSTPVISMMAGEGSFSAPTGQCKYHRSFKSAPHFD